MDIRNLSSPVLRRRRRRIVRDLPPIEQVLRGTLVETYKRCGRQNCHCAEGPGHGPKRYLSISQPGTGGRQRRDYVPNDIHEQVAQLIGNLPIKASSFDSFEWHAGLPERRFPMTGFVTCLQAPIHPQIGKLALPIDRMIDEKSGVCQADRAKIPVSIAKGHDFASLECQPRSGSRPSPPPRL